MPILDFGDDKKAYGKVLAALLRMGCLVEARDKSKLIVTLGQEESLRQLGVIDPKKYRMESTKNAKKKKKT